MSHNNRAPISSALASAYQFYNGKNFAAAEIISRQILDVIPQNAEALNILGIICAQLGLRKEAIGFLSAAKRADPKNPVINSNLERASAPLKTNASPDKKKYLIIKSWGFGFWADISSVLGNLLLAEVTGRTPIVHWGVNSLFGDRSANDAFQNYFAPVSHLSLKEVSGLHAVDFFPEKWNEQNLFSENLDKWSGKTSRLAAIHFLGRNETVAVSDFYIGVIDVLPWLPRQHAMYKKPLGNVYRYLIKKYLRPHSHIIAQCESFHRSRIGTSPFVAIHLRGSDKLLERNDLEASNRECIELLGSVPPDWRILALTDDHRWLNHLNSLYGDRVISTNCRRTDNNVGVHYLESNNGVEIGLEVMIDTYLATYADRFIGNGHSTVAAMIALLKDWKSNDCTLVRPSQLMERNLHIHAAPDVRT